MDIRKFFRTLWGMARETAWVVGLLAYLGPGGKLVVMVAGLGTGLIAALQGTSWAVVITLGLVSAAATVVVVVAARAARLGVGPDDSSLKPTFTVTSLTKTDETYDSGANHDVDGSSNGTSITVNKP